MKAWTEMTEEERQAACRAGLAVPLMPPADRTDPAATELAKWRAWAVRLLGCSEAYRTDDEELRNMINAASEPTPAEADTLRRDIDDLRTYRDVAHALTRAVVDCPLGYHDGRPIAHRATTNAVVVAWLQRLARISEAVEAIDATEAADADRLGTGGGR